VRIYNNLHNFKAKKPVVTIGTFDGVHKGHHIVLNRLKEIAHQTGGETVVFTFYPHPRLVLAPEEQSLRLLTTLNEKINLLRQANIHHMVVYPFTVEFAKLSYADFVKKVLVNEIGTNSLVVGYDHRFGKNREGGYEYLQKCADIFGFNIEKLDVLLMDEVNISSTRIRNALESGDISTANMYLGYRYTLHGKVVEGQKLGRTIGFPTANIESSDIHKLIPGYGVYAVEVEIDGKTYKGMLNIGSRPTFNLNADQRSIEVNIFDFEGELYGKEVTLIFIRKIRDERKFPGKDALVKQLHLDKESSLRIIAESENKVTE
jgi:riboflavin kinase / FMN adenylyltransferase